MVTLARRRTEAWNDDDGPSRGVILEATSGAAERPKCLTSIVLEVTPCWRAG